MNRNWARFAESGGAVWTVVAVLGAYALLTSEEFRVTANLTNLLRQMVVLGLASLAQFVVVLARGVDLSLGASVRLASIVAAIVMAGSDDNFLLGVLLAVGVSLTIGAANGLIVSRLRLEPFIATLGTGAVVSGIALYVASTPKGRVSPWWQDFYDHLLGPVPTLVVLAGIVVAAMWVLLAHTPWGRHLYAVGGDPSIARLSGLRVGAITVSAYMLAGLVAGLAGVVLIGRTGIGDSSAAVALEFESLAVVVIGGASLAGGRGRLIGVLGGVVLFSMLGNIFTLLRVEVWYQQLVRGFIILLAAALFVQRRTKSQTIPPASGPLPHRGPSVPQQTSGEADDPGR
jgi:ribose transport system permease protein